MENDNRVLYQFLDNNNVPFYFGITNNFKRRKCEHLQVLKKGKNGKSWPVYNKIKKLIREEGYELKMEIIQSNLSFKKANELEIEYIREYKNKGIKLYNLTAGGEGTSNHQPVFTKEWKKKLSEAKSGDKFKGEKNSFFGKHHSEETKSKISTLRKGKLTGDKNPFYGKSHTEEFKKMIGDKNRGANSKRVLKYHIISPDKSIYIVTDGLYEFCKRVKEAFNIKLSPASFAHTLSGKQKHHKGWLITYLD